MSNENDFKSLEISHNNLIHQVSNTKRTFNVFRRLSHVVNKIKYKKKIKE